MIVSHKHRFIFIKTRKTASTSVELALARICGPDDIVTAIRPPIDGHHPRNHRGLTGPRSIAKTLRNDRGPNRLAPLKRMLTGHRYYNHMPAFVVRRYVGEDVWNAYFTFTIERNPWDKTVSFYAHKRATRRDPPSFPEFVETRVLPRNHYLYSDPDGEGVIVDEIMRYEHLEDELRRITAELGIEDVGTLPHAKGSFRDRARHYSEHYTHRDLVEIVEQEFADEIRTMDYRFETGPG